MNRRVSGIGLLFVLALLLGACGAALWPEYEVPASQPSPTAPPVVVTNPARPPASSTAAGSPPAPGVEASPGPTPSPDHPHGLSSDQVATLSSLEQVDEYPLYVMRYYDEYGPEAHRLRPDGGLSPAWACSLFAALGDSEDRLYGRNFDWKYSPALLLFTDPPDGYASVSMVDIDYFGFDGQEIGNLPLLPLEELRPLLQAPHWPFDGMNEHGLAVGMAAVPQGHLPADRDKPTIGSLGIIREILDHARDVDGALALFEAYNIDMEGGPDLHYLVADRSGRSLLVEFFRGEMVVTPNEEPWHLATNFITASLPAASRPACRRYNGIEATLSEKEGRLDPFGATELLSQVSQDNTQWSVVYGLSTGQVRVTMGRQYGTTHAFHLSLAEPGAAP